MAEKHEKTVMTAVCASRSGVLQMLIRQRLLSATNGMSAPYDKPIDLAAILTEAAECAVKLGFRRQELEDVLSQPLQGALASITLTDADTVNSIVEAFTTFLAPKPGAPRFLS